MRIKRSMSALLACTLLVGPLAGAPAASQSRRAEAREAARAEARRLAEREEALSVKGSEWLRARQDMEAGQKALKQNARQVKKAETRLKRLQKEVAKAEAEIRNLASERFATEQQIAENAARMQRAEAAYDAARDAEEDAPR